MDDLISVIMSTYNETVNEIEASINSILHQSYTNIEFIIVIDNPNNHKLINYIQSFKDSRIKIIKNNKNIGLVKSLNKAIAVSNGKYIARMDADDISEPNRLEHQKNNLEIRNLDIIGGNIILINEKGEDFSKLSFPTDQSLLKFFLRWGNSLPHPTWMLKKEVYDKLNGYRNIPRCEDYDFICRALQNNYKIGNIDEFVLRYRIRRDSISNSNKGAQYVVRRLISRNRKRGISEEKIYEYLNSVDFKNELDAYEVFQELKSEIKAYPPNIKKVLMLVFNKNTYLLGCEKICLKIRNFL